MVSTCMRSRLYSMNSCDDNGDDDDDDDESFMVLLLLSVVDVADVAVVDAIGIVCDISR